MEMSWKCSQNGEEQWLDGGDGVASWRKKANGMTKDHMEKDSERGAQPGWCGPAGQKPGAITHQAGLVGDYNWSCLPSPYIL